MRVIWDHTEAYCEAITETLEKAYKKRSVENALKKISEIPGQALKFRSIDNMQINIDATDGLIP